jgi:prepilin-type N-terminal cleavage/methylation domain-containing protein/prepilin-type processing-associated H-X9-DG protein
MKQRGFTLIELLVVIAIIAILAAILFPVFARARAKAQQNNCLANVKQLTLSTLMYCADYDDYYPWAWGWFAFTPPFVEWWSGEIYPYNKNLQIYACPANSTVPGYQTTNGWGAGPIVSPTDYRENPCLGNMGMGPGCSSGSFSPIKQAQNLRPAELLCVIACTPGGGPGYDANPDVGAANYTGGDPTLNTSYSPTYYCPNIETAHNKGGNVGYCDGHAKWLSQQILYAWDATSLRMWNNVP